MGFLPVGVVHGGRGVELAGGEELVLVNPLVCVVWHLAYPGPRGDYGDAGPRAEKGAVGRAGHPIVSRLLAGQMVVSPGHRADQGFVLRGRGRRAFLYHLERGVEVGVFRLQPRENVFQAPDQLFVRLGRHGADVQGYVGARGDHVDLGVPEVGPHEDGRRKARITEEWVLAVALYLLPLQLLDRDHEPRGPRNGVDPAQGHGPVRHPATHGDLDPERALLARADLVLLGFADNGGVNPLGMSVLDERLDARHHPLLVDRVTEYQGAGERDTRVPYGSHSHHGSRKVPLGVAGAAPVEAPAHTLSRERWMFPF